jgi:hypothetical protein
LHILSKQTLPLTRCDRLSVATSTGAPTSVVGHPVSTTTVSTRPRPNRTRSRSTAPGATRLSHPTDRSLCRTSRTVRPVPAGIQTTYASPPEAQRIRNWQFREPLYTEQSAEHHSRDAACSKSSGLAVGRLPSTAICQSSITLASSRAFVSVVLTSSTSTP